VALSAWYGGRGPGVLAAILCLFTVDYFFLAPLFSLDLNWTSVPRIGTYIVVALLVGTLSTRRREAQRQVQSNDAKMQFARAIQQRLYPASAPVLPGLDIAGTTLPADSTCGDYFDYIPFLSGSLGVVLGDVAGHGFGAALLMAETRAYLRALALTTDDVGRILTLTNRFLSEDSDEQFVTLFFASVDPRTSSVVYASAGHEAYMIEPAGTVRKLLSTSIPLGIDKDLVVPCAPLIHLDAGQVVTLFTDGLIEASSPQGTLFGIDGILDVARANRAKSAIEITDAATGAVQKFMRGQLQRDDLTVVTLKCVSQSVRTGSNNSSLRFHREPVIPAAMSSRAPG